ncbi:MAG: hypothetical protein M5U34_48270 [Chloroflexi bacterium]|nr:hypothetical protein [Chloroflexota bacterium]
MNYAILALVDDKIRGTKIMLAQVHLDSELVTSLEEAVRQQGENVEDVLARIGAAIFTPDAA